MKMIKLPKGVWEYNPEEPLGDKGGFGEVFLGKSKAGDPVAVKRLMVHASDAAHRELRIAEELSDRKLDHVIPIFDSGEDVDTGSYFVIMPIADRSLQDAIDIDGTFSAVDTADILLQIVAGLEEVSDIVHRDIKPDNILHHEGKWKIADFGIAKFHEDVTSLKTLKGCLSPLYAAPEQWNFERSTDATDVYALGCIGISLLEGSPPFSGDTEDLKIAHLTGSLPPFSLDNPRLKSLLSMMLRKTPESRPDIERVKTILLEIKNSDSDSGRDQSVLDKLAEIGCIVADRESIAEAEEAKKNQIVEQRTLLASEAINILKENFKCLTKKISDSAISAKVKFAGDRLGMVSLGDARIILKFMRRSPFMQEDKFEKSGWDVVTMATIEISHEKPAHSTSSSLWYVRLPEDKNYRWFETSYRVNPAASNVREALNPFCLGDGDIHEADIAAAKTMGTFCIAFGPVPIDDEDEVDFHDRWLHKLSEAAVS